MALSRTDRIRAAEGDFLGHPRGLTFLFTTEMWERFSYYGMRALLVLYMVKYLLLPGHDDVIGLGAVRGVLEHRRDRAYSIFYVGINVGAFLAPLVCGRSARSWAGIMGSPLPASA